MTTLLIVLGILAFLIALGIAHSIGYTRGLRAGGQERMDLEFAFNKLQAEVSMGVKPTTPPAP